MTGRAAALAATALAVATRPAAAQLTLGIGSSPPPLVVTTPIAGTAPASVQGTASYTLVGVTLVPRNMTMHLSAALPPGVTLRATVTAPLGAASAGEVELSTAPATVVSGLGTVTLANFGITYRLSATLAAGVVPSTTRTVTLTLVAGT